MAEKKNVSRAEQAVSDVKKTHNASSKSSAKNSKGGKTTQSKSKGNSKAQKKSSSVPANVMVAIVSLGLFFLFAVISVKPDGALLRFVRSVLLGVLGHAGFYFAIPALLYIFILHTFCRRAAVTMRSICTVVFVLISGCTYHLLVNSGSGAEGLALITDLYWGGIDGSSGGVLCGGIAMLLRWGCGSVLSI